MDKKKEECRFFLRIKDEDESKVDEINNKELAHLKPFKHGCYGGVHTWVFDCRSKAQEAKKIIKKIIPRSEKF